MGGSSRLFSAQRMVIRLLEMDNLLISTGREIKIINREDYQQ